MTGVRSSQHENQENPALLAIEVLAHGIANALALSLMYDKAFSIANLQKLIGSVRSRPLEMSVSKNGLGNDERTRSATD
jgi:hypothetical protein